MIFPVLSALLAVAAIVLCWSLFRTRRVSGTPPLHSIVLLLDRYQQLHGPALAETVGRALGRTVNWQPDAKAAQRAGEGVWLTGGPPNFILYIDHEKYSILTVDEPYGNLRSVSLFMREERTRRALASHWAWMSVDAHHNPAGSAHRRAMGRIAAELLDPHCLALFYPPQAIFSPVSPDRIEPLREHLRSADSLEELFAPAGGGAAAGFIPVFSLGQADPRIAAAEAEARRRFPEFEKAFRERIDHLGDYSVKMPLRSGDSMEHIWMDVESIDDATGRIKGVLGNEPVDLEGYHRGSHVEVNRNEIEDWCVVPEDGSEPIGLFTPPVLREIEDEEEERR